MYQIKRERIRTDPEPYRAFDLAASLEKSFVVVHMKRPPEGPYGANVGGGPSLPQRRRAEASHGDPIRRDRGLSPTEADAADPCLGSRATTSETRAVLAERLAKSYSMRALALYSSIDLSRQHPHTRFLFPGANSRSVRRRFLAGCDYSALSASTGLTAAARAVGK
jgi:hypothetical protein